MNITTVRWVDLDEAASSSGRCTLNIALSDRIDSIIAGEKVELFFQPIVRLTGWPQLIDVVGYEALARFCPCCLTDNVFSEADRLGKRPELELALLRQALAWLPAMPYGAFLNLNVSPAAIVHPDFASAIEFAPLKLIVFDVSANAGDVDPIQLGRMLDRVQQAGGRIAADDTGADTKSAHPAMFHQNIVKIDGTIVSEIDSIPWKQTLANAFKGMAWLVGADVVAEGIETIAELSELRSQGIGYGQGNLLARPAPAAVLFATGHAA